VAEAKAVLDKDIVLDGRKLFIDYSYWSNIQGKSTEVKKTC